MVLETYLPPPKIMFENDTFTYNEKLETMNKIGTIRNQYDWTPTITIPSTSLSSKRTMENSVRFSTQEKSISAIENQDINNEILDRIEPILKYINYAAELKSTKVSQMNDIYVCMYVLYIFCCRNIITCISVVLLVVHRYIIYSINYNYIILLPIL